MEPEAEQLMHDGMAKNYIDYEEYPATCEIQNKCVAIIGNLFNVPKGKEGEEPMYVNRYRTISVDLTKQGSLNSGVF